MRYCDFCAPFYAREHGLCGLKGLTSQKKIGEFFIRAALGAKADEFLVHSEDTYRKWFTGDRNIAPELWSEMSKVTDLYLKLKEYSSTLTAGYEEVFYNANRDLNYQNMLIISAVRSDDSDEDVKRKIQMVSKFVDIFASIRIFNFRKVNWNTNKYLLKTTDTRSPGRCSSKEEAR